MLWVSFDKDRVVGIVLDPPMTMAFVEITQPINIKITYFDKSLGLEPLFIPLSWHIRIQSRPE